MRSFSLFFVFLAAMLTTLVHDAKTAPIASVLRIRYSVKWASGSAPKRTMSVVKTGTVA